MVLTVAETFGYVRETNYGELFDVRVVPDPDNLAFTSRAILPQTGNPWSTASPPRPRCATVSRGRSAWRREPRYRSAISIKRRS